MRTDERLKVALYVVGAFAYFALLGVVATAITNDPVAGWGGAALMAGITTIALLQRVRSRPTDPRAFMRTYLKVALVGLALFALVLIVVLMASGD